MSGRTARQLSTYQTGALTRDDRPREQRRTPTENAPAALVAALSRAVDRAVDHWSALDDGLPADQARMHIVTLANAVQTVALGETPHLREFPPKVPARRLIDTLRGNFLDEVRMLDETREGPAILRWLRAIEHVHATIERDTALRFASRLAGPDALNLIVEVAHDMRSPLGSILFLVETLRKGQSGPITSIQERQLGLVYNAAFGLSSLASDIIELARGCDRLVDLQPIPFSVREILQSVVDIIQPIAEEKGLRMTITALETDFRVGYPAALSRVLLNLTTNALKFTSQGSVDVTTKALSRTRVEFAIQDTGRGIPDRVLRTLFDAFRRRQQPGEYAFSSAGLGLSICQKLVEAMGGELKVETALESGTRFSFELELPPAQRM